MDIAICTSILCDGGVIIYPTDTVYGIGCNPYFDKSVERIYKIKGRDQKKALPILGSNIGDIERIVQLNPIAKTLAQHFWPGALTIVSPCIDDNISKQVIAGGDKLAVRIPDNKCTRDLISSCKFLIGTSANFSGQEPCISSSDIISSGISGYDALLDGGILVKGRESTIVEVLDSDMRILRHGAIKSDKIYEVVSTVLKIDLRPNV
jgi:L-threonylcarbamoyladenylate synthase